MATIGIRVMSVCAGGNHLNVRVQLNGQTRALVQMAADDVTGTPSDDDLQAATAVLIRAYAIGKTKAAVTTGLQAGIDVVV